MSSIIYHVTTPAYFEQFEGEDSFYPEGWEDEGFIHCSYERQLPRIFEKYYSEEDYLVLLKIDIHKLKAEFKIELSLSVGQEFPHVYGEINMDAVIEIISQKNPSYNE